MAERIEGWLWQLEDALRDVILETDDRAKLEPIRPWANFITSNDTVVTFNYDTLAERALSEVGKSWNHATGRAEDSGVAVCKLHGSIDWIVAHRSESFSRLDLLFDKENTNRPEANTGHVEDDFRLWRCQTREQLRKWVWERDPQIIPDGASARTAEIAGIKTYK